MIPFDGQPSNDDFDIITLNIDADFPIDTQDEILFKNDHQFDLASYIGGESSSLLLSPIINDASARRRLMSVSDFGHLESHNAMIATKTAAKNLSRMAMVEANTVHDKVVTKTPACNRRKRKNLSREFIESSDSDSDDSKSKNGIINVVDDGKSNKLAKPRKENDPVWNPTVDKRATKVLKPAAIRTKETVDHKDSAESKKIAGVATKTGQSAQGNGLRNLLKQQLLSDRPVNKNKLLKTMSMPSDTSEKLIVPKVVPHPVKRMGVGRGKDIQITAKYYNVNESSDNNERDKSVKQDRFHQIYTDSDTTSHSESESDSDDSDIEVNSEPLPPKKVIVEEKSSQAVEIDSNKEKPQKINLPKRSSADALKQFIQNKISTNDKRKPTMIDSNSMDSTDFAKALVTNAKIVTTKTKSNAAKKNNLEQQKRIIQSNMLLHNPAKFKITTADKPKLPSNGVASSTEVRPTPAVAEHKVEPFKPIQVFSGCVAKETSTITDTFKSNHIETPQHNGNLSPNEQAIKSESAKEVDNVQNNQEIQEDVKPDTLSIDESKFESSSKRKLNIQEYLKRKSLKTTHSGDATVRNYSVVNIKAERIENGMKADSNEGNNATSNDEASPNNSFTGNSMYEEIIIVSMGCNTDISIPASFNQPSEMKDGDSVKSNVLLSDISFIQTSVEKANSKISCMSLISSIQDVILKKTHSIEQSGKRDAATGDAVASDSKEKTDEVPEHGENKTIMHLRKDRVRPTRVSTSVQTDPYFQFPPLEKLTPLSKKQTSTTEKRVGSMPRDLHFVHNENKNKAHRNYRGPNRLSESSYYSDEDEEKSIQRRSRHSDFVEHNNGRHSRVRRESSRYSSSKYDRYINRHRTISRSLSSSSDNSTTSTDSSSSSQSSNTSSSYVSSASQRSLNSYGGSSSKSHYGDDHQYYRKRTVSNNSRRSNYRHGKLNRTNSPG